MLCISIIRRFASISQISYFDCSNIINQILYFICTDTTPHPINVCQPSPCGPNSQCREVNHQAVCSCLPAYQGSPPSCRPECVVSSECPSNKACINQKCVDPCPGPCGQNANCQTIHHSPICSCRNGFTGDAFSRCYPIPGTL